GPQVEPQPEEPPEGEAAPDGLAQEVAAVRRGRLGHRLPSGRIGRALSPALVIYSGRGSPRACSALPVPGQYTERQRAGGPLRLAERLRDAVVQGRQVADRVGGRGVAGEQEGLAAAAAEVRLAARAAPAGLRHPAGAAEAAEDRRLEPG